jgi:hypothetical protein
MPANHIRQQGEVMIVRHRPSAPEQLTCSLRVQDELSEVAFAADLLA